MLKSSNTTIEAARQRILATPLYIPPWLKEKLESDEHEMAIFNYIHYGTITPKLIEAFRGTKNEGSVAEEN